MPCKLLCVSKLVLAALGTSLLLIPVGLPAQLESTVPPIWSGEGNVPKQYGNRKVFLSPDEHSLIILWPSQDGTGATKLLRTRLHNVIYPKLRVRIDGSSAGFVYRYDLENKTQSEDAITTFGIVIYPDPKLQAGAVLWTGGKSTAMVGKRIGIPEAPDGGLALWFCPETQPLLPGTATKFTLITQAAPGFTTASTEHYPHLDALSDEWPEEILNELGPVLQPSWIDQHIITFGPRYGSDERAAYIAADYLVGIRKLISQGRFDSNSPFMKDVIATLEAVNRGSSTRLVLTERPRSEIETEMLNALDLSLHINLESR
jgi:hypothetical protein